MPPWWCASLMAKCWRMRRSCSSGFTMSRTIMTLSPMHFIKQLLRISTVNAWKTARKAVLLYMSTRFVRRWRDCLRTGQMGRKKSEHRQLWHFSCFCALWWQGWSWGWRGRWGASPGKDGRVTTALSSQGGTNTNPNTWHALTASDKSVTVLTMLHLCCSKIPNEPWGTKILVYPYSWVPKAQLPNLSFPSQDLLKCCGGVRCEIPVWLGRARNVHFGRVTNTLVDPFIPPLVPAARNM